MLSGQVYYQGKAAASSFQISIFQNTGKFKLGRFAETIIYICAYFNYYRFYQQVCKKCVIDLSLL